ncbi:MAG: SUMF1/EgtB/PvdO family nonheme iron enzyme [Planctomycetota bacterium]|nr:SUMF1/EgtB/PvdO family nonheme iron enzyme [Planctomycetota bacterium]
MFVSSFFSVTALAVVTTLSTSVAVASIHIPTVSIGNANNAVDFSSGLGFVGYAYNIGQTEVTNAQYAAFLNAVARTDAHGLYYEPGMVGPFGGIIRNGSPGSYTYATIASRENHPVTYVSFWDTVRFANWLHNGQPAGPQDSSTTEDGAYTLTPEGIADNTITRNSGWRWAVTSQDEWYKAAYHQPSSQGGDSDNYWSFPNSADFIAPTEANYLGSGIDNTLPVGSYDSNYYGAFDMAGNVFEWNDWIAFDGFSRGIRGGCFFTGEEEMRAAFAPFFSSVTRHSRSTLSVFEFLRFQPRRASHWWR